MLSVRAAFTVLFTMTTSLAAADVLPRTAPVAGTVVAVRTGEEGDFPERPGWRPVDVQQQVKSGDVLRTNALGQLAILFSDQTQIRLGRNTTLRVKDLVPGVIRASRWRRGRSGRVRPAAARR